jgi:thiol-disulfide isomerase/thioredoxin
MKTILSVYFILFIFTLSNAQPAPDFTVTDIAGNEHKLYEDYLNQGKSVLIKIYFTTCPPCRIIAPQTQTLYEEWGSGQNDVEFFEITVRDWETDSMHLAYKAQFGITFPTIGGPGGASAARTPYVNGQYGQYGGTPTFVVISPTGAVNYNIEGANTNATIALLDAALIATGAQKPGGGMDQAPITRGTTVNTEFNTPIVIQPEFFGQDSPADSNNIIFKPASGTGSSGGSFTQATSCTGCILYAPNEGFVGLDQINYCVIDAESDTSNVSTITVEVKNEVIMDSTITVSGVIRDAQGAILDATVTIRDGLIIVAELANPYSYSFSSADLNEVQEYTIEATKTDGLINGVSAFDIRFIQKHLLGIEPFTNNYQAIAADANGTGTVTALDLVAIQKLLLGVTSSFEVDSWRIFVEEDIRQDIQNRQLQIKDILDSSYSGDFIGIKTGDPSGN